MNWNNLIKSYQTYLILERKLSPNSITAYLFYLDKFVWFLKDNKYNINPGQINREHFAAYFQYLTEKGICAKSQAHIVTCIKGFYKYLTMEEILMTNPTIHIASPRFTRKLPDILNIPEVNIIVNSIDTCKRTGIRNLAMIETLYSCGLRASELANLKIQNLHFEKGYIKILGKGDIERVVPINVSTIEKINDYIAIREKPQAQYRDFLFLNGRGEKITRMTLHQIIKHLLTQSGIKKRISTHTFRHSFATHLMEAGADIRAIQGLLGHKSIATTEIYTHLDVEHLKKTITMYHPRG